MLSQLLFPLLSKYVDQSKLRKDGTVLAHCSKVQSFRVGISWQKELRQLLTLHPQSRSSEI